MPNWCEGSLKLKGDPKDILRFINEGLNVYEYDYRALHERSSNVMDKSKWMSIVDNTDSVEIYFDHDEIYVEDTQRAFINLVYTGLAKRELYIDKHKNPEICVMHVSQAWGFRDENWIEIAKKYNLDIRLTGIEQGMGFMEDLIITRDGEVTDLSPSYKDYDDFEWNCPIPFLGG